MLPLLIVVFSVFSLFSSTTDVGDYLFGRGQIIGQGSPHCSCSTTPGDPFDPGFQFQEGFYRGQCIDSCQYRAPVLLDWQIPSASMEVANLLHKNVFWKTKFSMRSVRSVQILFETFAPGINHVAFLFTLEKPVYLKNQTGDSKITEIIDSFVISPEGAPPLDKKYSMKDGFLGRYPLMLRLMSWDQYKKFVKKTGHPLRFYQTRFDKKERQELLRMSLLQATKTMTTYQLVFNNCATSVIDLSLQAKKEAVAPGWDLWDVADPLRGIPSDFAGTVRSLRWWEVIESSASPISL
jgi:Domain of unknown function (DUF4105)